MTPIERIMKIVNLWSKDSRSAFIENLLSGFSDEDIDDIIFTLEQDNEWANNNITMANNLNEARGSIQMTDQTSLELAISYAKQHTFKQIEDYEYTISYLTKAFKDMITLPIREAFNIFEKETGLIYKDYRTLLEYYIKRVNQLQ